MTSANKDLSKHAEIADRIIGNVVQAKSPAVSPDGSTVAFVVSRVDMTKNKNLSQVWLAAADGSRGSPSARGRTLVPPPGTKPSGMRPSLPFNASLKPPSPENTYTRSTPEAAATSSVACPARSVRRTSATSRVRATCAVSGSVTRLAFGLTIRTLCTGRAYVFLTLLLSPARCVPELESTSRRLEVFRDLTVERGLEEAKSDFIATVSHELRTPMTAVLGAAKTLLREDIALSPERRQQLLEMIGAQGTRLTQITEEVLLANRLDRGDVRIDSERVDLAQLVREAVQAMREQLPDSVTLTASTDSNGGAAVGDPNRIEQVLVNLIDNAVKYSPDGGSVIVRTAPAAAAVRVEVTDQGMGIAPAEQEAVFEKFYRADPQHRAVPSGTGLGLYICRELVRRMGGTIGVRSAPGEGSTFFFELPRA